MRIKYVIFMTLFFVSMTSLFCDVVSLDVDDDGKVDRWINCVPYSQWTRFDSNKNNKADESIFYKNSKGVVYLIKNERIDFTKNGKPDIWIINTFKGNDFFKETRIDNNRDSKIDFIVYEKNDIVYKQELDSDSDGKIDTFEYFDDKGVKTKESMDTNKDSIADDFYFFEGNKLIRQEIDSNYDKKADMWVKFVYAADGKLDKSLIFMDKNFDGKPDEWHYTNKKRQVIKIERDTNFDGKIDKVDNMGKR